MKSMTDEQEQKRNALVRLFEDPGINFDALKDGRAPVMVDKTGQ
jgi:hypothetical protein